MRTFRFSRSISSIFSQSTDRGRRWRLQNSVAGEIRELQNVVERSVILACGGALEFDLRITGLPQNASSLLLLRPGLGKGKSRATEQSRAMIKSLCGSLSSVCFSSFNTLPAGIVRTVRRPLINHVIWDRICRSLITSCGVVHWCDTASPPPLVPAHPRRSCRESDDTRDWNDAFLLAASGQSEEVH